MPTILDITPLVSDRLAVWPGDVPFTFRRNASLEAGDNIDLGSITTTVHVGAHADAPSHYRAGGSSIEACSLVPYLGPAQVVDVRGCGARRLEPRDLPGSVRQPRVLFRTGTFPDPESFREDFASLSPELIDCLAAEGVVLVGIDTPSVDPFSSRALEAHQALARHGMLNLEGLVLDEVGEGDYQLVALPLRLAGADASPVRAVLVVEDGS